MVGNENGSAFPNGFLFDQARNSCPKGFIEGPLLPGLFLDPMSWVSTAEDNQSGKFVLIIGTCKFLSGKENVARELVEVFSQEREEGLLKSLDNLVGRYVILFGSRKDIYVVGDATSMRPVFYADGGGAIASHAALLAGRETGAEEILDFPFSSSFPGNFTPYKGVRILPPNFTLELATAKLQRFWPLAPIEQNSTERAASRVLDLSTKSWKALTEDRDVWAALTAGLDSRVMLAVALNAGGHLKAFTYGSNRGTYVDRKVAAQMGKRFGFQHFEVATERPSGELKSALARAHFWDHHWSAVGPLRQLIANPNAAVLSANILEIGQSNFRKLQWNGGVEEPKTAEQMATVYHRKLSKNAKTQVENYGKSKYMEEVAAYFQKLIDDTGGPSEFLDPFDEYYWSIRMGTWHGPSSVEKDFYGEPLNPFNNRRIIETLLSVSKADQYDLSVFLRLITMVNCELLDMPINPSSVPPSW